jgi:hypothetical protein
VLAHRRLVDARGLGLSRTGSCRPSRKVDDPVLAKIWIRPVRIPQFDRLLSGLGHVVDAEDRRWVFVLQQTCVATGPEPWVVGQYFPLEGTANRRSRPGWPGGAIVGAATLAGRGGWLALLIGLSMVALRSATITSAAESIERLEVRPAGSTVARDCREIRTMAGRKASTRTRGALKWFRRLCARTGWSSG